MSKKHVQQREVQLPPAEIDYDNTFHPVEVKVNGNGREDIEIAMRRFKMLFQKEGVVGFVKDKSAYEKPSDKKRRKSREAEERKYLLAVREKLVASGEWDRMQKQRMQKKLTKDEKRAKENLNAKV